ncbi:hypothetical protein BD311DRAFT_767157 [Dichomitus squalens]|uniref:Uncharacterized protein n=1 Tax=Dichomitus squalens TaxID=114155 RepID=A0A4V2JZ87_9APHY|nr:hypothetical protein BD311DRAFT_767157 [Dichomitus squalens]
MSCRGSVTNLTSARIRSSYCLSICFRVYLAAISPRLRLSASSTPSGRFLSLSKHTRTSWVLLR